MDFRVEVTRVVKTLHLIKDVSDYTKAEQVAIAEHHSDKPCQLEDKISSWITSIKSAEVSK